MLDNDRPMDEICPAEILITRQRLQVRVADLAREIRREIPGPVHLVGVLKGAFVFLSDLVRELSGQLTVDFIEVSSYPSGTTTSGEVRLLKDLDAPLAGRDVIIVEDVVDTGLTLNYLQHVLRTRHPRSLRTVSLLDKPSRRRVSVQVDYVGFSIGDRFVVGYGLDYGEQYRNLPFIAVLDPPSGSGPSERPRTRRLCRGSRS